MLLHYRIQYSNNTNYSKHYRIQYSNNTDYSKHQHHNKHDNSTDYSKHYENQHHNNTDYSENAVVCCDHTYYCNHTYAYYSYETNHQQRYNLETDYPQHITHNNSESHRITGNTYDCKNNHAHDTYHQSQNDCRHNQYHYPENICDDFPNHGNDPHDSYCNDYWQHVSHYFRNTSHDIFDNTADYSNGDTLQCRSDQRDNYDTYHQSNYYPDNAETNYGISDEYHVCGTDQPHHFCDSFHDWNHQHGNDRQQCIDWNTDHTPQHAYHDTNHHSY